MNHKQVKPLNKALPILNEEFNRDQQSAGPKVHRHRLNSALPSAGHPPFQSDPSATQLLSYLAMAQESRPEATQGMFWMHDANSWLRAE